MFSRWAVSAEKQHEQTLNVNLQVFVANPRKPAHIENILRRNKAKLLTFLQGFHNDRDGKYYVLR